MSREIIEGFDRLRSLADGPVMGSFWKNKKTGGVYIIVGHVTNATNAQEGQEMVLYRRLADPWHFVRERSEFLEKFERTEAPR